jgi:hypothetical protein
MRIVVRVRGLDVLIEHSRQLPASVAALHAHVQIKWFNCYCVECPMACRDKEQLAAEYEATTKNFAQCVRELSQNIGTSSIAQYQRLQRASDDARVKSEQARLALERHVATHRC